MKLKDLEEGVLGAILKGGAKKVGKSALKLAKKIGPKARAASKKVVKKAEEVGKAVGKDTKKIVPDKKHAAALGVGVGVEVGTGVGSKEVVKLQDQIKNNTAKVGRWKKRPKSDDNEAKIKRAEKEIDKWKKDLKDIKSKAR